MIDYVDENKYIINCACDCMGRDEMKRLFLTEVLRKRWVRTLTARIIQRFLRSARAAHPLFSWQRAPWRRCGCPCRRRRKSTPAQTRLFGFSQHVPLPAIVFRQIRAQKQRFNHPTRETVSLLQTMLSYNCREKMNRTLSRRQGAV